MTGLSLLSFIALTVKEKVWERNRKLEKAFDEINTKSLKRYLKAEELNNRIIVDIEQEDSKYHTVINQADPQLWGYWLTLAGLSHRITIAQDLTGDIVDSPPKHITADAQYFPVESQEISFEAKQPDLAGWMGEKLKNHLIVGVPGSGKGMLVANALRRVTQRGDTTIFFLDPKNDPKEYAYIDGVANYIYRLPGGIMRSDPEDTKAWLEDSIQSFEAYEVEPGKTKLLVLDELTAVITALKSASGKAKNVDWLSGRVITYCVSGGSEGVRYWGIGQAATNDMVGMPGGVKAQLVPIALINVDELPASQNLMAAQFIPPGKKLSSSEIRSICKNSPVGRAVYHGGFDDWFPVPVMKNHSGYDRDSGKFTDTDTDTPVFDIVHEEDTSLPPLPDNVDWYEELVKCIIAAKEAGIEPTQEQITKTWTELTGRVLTKGAGGAALMEMLRARGVI